jgi:tol-pal system protein YbgF
LTAALVVAALYPLAGYAQDSGAQGADTLAARLGRLEQKVKDLQVMVGTLESLLRAKPGTVLPQEVAPQVVQGAGAGELVPRLDALETQISALTNHIEQIGKKMSALEAKLAAIETAKPAPIAPAAPPAAEPPPPASQSAAPQPLPDTATATAPPQIGDEGDTSKPRWYGPKPGSDELADLLERQAASDPQNITAALPSGDAQALYQQGYGALLQKDYGAAEIAFKQMVDSFPNDPLAANAQYWLGETYYVRGHYKNAADAFLKGYKKYKSGDKAPDTLLKLGMSLAELGQKSEACSTFDELKTKYPGAPEDIAEEAKAWRKKTGC